MQQTYKEEAGAVCESVRERETVHLHTSNPISECLSGWESALWEVCVCVCQKSKESKDKKS